MFELLVAIDLVFWIPACFFLFLLCVAVYEESGLGSTAGSIVLVMFLAGMDFFWHRDILGWVNSHLPNLILDGLFYLAGALLWPLIKWWFVVRERLFKFEEKREEILNKARRAGFTNFLEDFRNRERVTREDKRIPDSQWQYFNDYSHAINFYGLPKVSDYKSRILIWVIWWPLSLIVSLLDEPLRHLGLWVYRTLSGTMTSISRLVYRRYLPDLE